MKSIYFINKLHIKQTMQGISRRNTSHFKDSISPHNNTPSSAKNKFSEDSRKIFCAYHPNQFLTNFCIQKNCLMPLCPNCVVEHTQEHYQCNQKPSYLNLHEAIEGVKRKCYEHITNLEQYNMRNDEITNFVSGLPEYVRKQLEECRLKMHQSLDRTFDDYEKKLIDEIRQKYASEQVFQRRECDEVKEYIHSQIDVLYDKINKIKGQNCLAEVIKYYSSQENDLLNEMTAIDLYLQKNKKAGGLYIDLNLENMQMMLENCCEKIVNVQYLPHPEHEQIESSKRDSRRPLVFSSIVKKVSNALSKSQAKSQSKIDKTKVKKKRKNIMEIENNIYHSPFRGDF